MFTFQVCMQSHTDKEWRWYYPHSPSGETKKWDTAEEALSEGQRRYPNNEVRSAPWPPERKSCPT